MIDKRLLSFKRLSSGTYLAPAEHFLEEPQRRDILLHHPDERESLWDRERMATANQKRAADEAKSATEKYDNRPINRFTRPLPVPPHSPEPSTYVCKRFFGAGDGAAAVIFVAGGAGESPLAFEAIAVENTHGVQSVNHGGDGVGAHLLAPGRLEILSLHAHVVSKTFITAGNH